MVLVIIGIAVALNLLIVLRKFQKGQHFNALIDGTLLVLVALVFSKSTDALVIGTIGSLIVSIYLTFSPLKVGAK